jgi:hypothetical protein
LWPLLHGLVEQPVFERSWWRTYHAVNERFAAPAPGDRFSLPFPRPRSRPGALLLASALWRGERARVASGALVGGDAALLVDIYL